MRFSETVVRLNLPPGRYEVRAAMRNTADNRTGSVYTSVVVPNFAREPLSLSGLVVERQATGAAMLVDLASVVPVRPTTARVFSAAERVAVAARVYQGRGRSLAPVRVSARIVDGQDRTVSAAETTRNGKPTAGSTFRLLAPLPGEYLLTIDASTATTSSRRTLRFTVRR